MGPSLDKETVLSKVINNIDTFRINLTHGDEETKKKYIRMILKLDSSKTIMLDTRGPEVRTRNKEELVLNKGQKIPIEHAEFFKDSFDTLYIDYNQTQGIQEGTILNIDNESVIIEVIKNKWDALMGKVLKGGLVLINRHIDFDGYIPELPYMGEKDKRHIVRGIEHKINTISVSYIKEASNVAEIRDFLRTVDGEHLKVIAKIETLDAIKNLKSIIESADGIIISRKKLLILADEKKATKIKNDAIKYCNTIGKPLIRNTDMNVASKKESKVHADTIREKIAEWIDVFMLTRDSAVAEEPIENIFKLYEIINEEQIPTITDYSLKQVSISEDDTISDYIAYNAYRTSKEMPIKAIICPTESGYTPARLAALKPSVPIIAFTKNDMAYRYLNLLRWVKGYKIADTFEYTNIKQIGKEIIRILFKWNISLDDKILIVHSSLEQNKAGMINGMELYKFKDI